MIPRIALMRRDKCKLIFSKGASLVAFFCLKIEGIAGIFAESWNFNNEA